MDTRRTLKDAIPEIEARFYLDTLLDYKKQDVSQVTRQIPHFSDAELAILKTRLNTLYRAVADQTYRRSPKGKVNAIKQTLYKQYLTQQESK